MKSKFSFFLFALIACSIYFSSCESNFSADVKQGSTNKDQLLKPRTGFTATWDICRPCSEGNQTFRIRQYGTQNYIDITPTCGSPDCGDDGSGTICSQARINISISGTFGWNASTCTLTLPYATNYVIRQISTGTCNTHGFDWNPDPNCTSSPMGDIYIKSQVYPDCTPYNTNTTCIDIDNR